MRLQSENEIFDAHGSIAFQLHQMKRKTFEIKIQHDGLVIVKAPIQMSLTAIQSKLLEKLNWIRKKQRWFLEHPKPQPKQYIDGESHLYLGRLYRLSVVEGAKNFVRQDGLQLSVSVKGAICSAKVKTHLDRWYLENAQFYFNQYLDECWILFQSMLLDESISKPSLKCRNETTLGQPI